MSPLRPGRLEPVVLARSTDPRLELHCGRSVVLAAIARRQVIDRDSATKLPSAASGLLTDTLMPPASSSGGRGAPRTATHRSTRATSANIAYAEGEVLRVGADALIVLHHVVVVEDDQRDQPREPPAGWQRAPRKRLLLSPFKPTQQPREVRGTRAAAPSVALETSWIVVLRPSHKPPPGNRGVTPMYKS